MINQQLAFSCAQLRMLSRSFKRPRFAINLPLVRAPIDRIATPGIVLARFSALQSDKWHSLDVGPELFESKMTNATAFKPLSKEDLADLLGVSIRTIENWVNEGILPAPTKLGNRVYWHPNTFYAWLDRRLSADPAAAETTQPSTAEPKSASAHKTKSLGQSATAKSELDKVRNRTLAQLDALMGASASAT